MKSTIIFLGFAVLNFTNSIAANELKAQDLVQQDVVMVSADSAQYSSFTTSGAEHLKSKMEATGEETTVFNPNTVIQSGYVKTIADVINDNKLVTEAANDTYQPVVLEMSVEDKIAENNQIVESYIDNNTYPLDFEKINRSVKETKATNNCVAVPVEIKL